MDELATQRCASSRSRQMIGESHQHALAHRSLVDAPLG